MIKVSLCAGVLFFTVSALHAQHTDGLVTPEGNFNAIEYGLDEINKEDLALSTSISPVLLKSISLLNNDAITYSTINQGRNKGIIIGTLNGKELFSSEFKRSNFHGLWKSKYINGHLIDSGNFNNNIPDGLWKTWYPDGTLRSIRNYSSEKWFAVKNEVKKRGSKVHYHSLSSKVAFNHNNFETYTKASSSFNSLPPAGNGKNYEPPYKFCLHNGLFMNFYPNGMVKDSGYYKEGLKDGLWNEYYSNGQLNSSGSYYRGFKNSGWKYYNKDGKLTMLCLYKQGKLIHKKTY